MHFTNTERLLSEITDEGLFEKLVMAVLRENKPEYREAIHTGMNIEGKTVKAPLDGVCIVQGHDGNNEAIAFHHTTTRLKDLETKWLLDLANVKPRKKGNKPTGTPGDLIKTAEVIDKIRKEIPDTNATLVLTTNQEPDLSLFTKAKSAAQSHKIVLDIWTRTRIAHFLDNTSNGQWLRYSYLGVQQEMLSEDLLRKLGQDSLDIHHPMDSPKNWVTRKLDSQLNTCLKRSVTFLVADSGHGKSVACYRRLKSHIDGGGLSTAGGLNWRLSIYLRGLDRVQSIIIPY